MPTTATTVLQETLATLMVASVHTRQCHWCMSGPNFGPLHELFGKLYDQLDVACDRVAERIREIGGRPMTGDIESMIKMSEIKDRPFTCPMTGEVALEAMIQENTVISYCLKEYIEELEGDKINDCASSQILLDLLIANDHYGYLLRSHLQ